MGTQATSQLSEPAKRRLETIWLFIPLIEIALTVVCIVVLALIFSTLSLFPHISEMTWIAAIVFVLGIRICHRLPHNREKLPWEQKE